MTENEENIMYLALARGIFMGLADDGNNIHPLFPEIHGDWHHAMHDPDEVKRLADHLRKNNLDNPKTLAKITTL